MTSTPHWGLNHGNGLPYSPIAGKRWRYLHLMDHETAHRTTVRMAEQGWVLAMCDPAKQRYGFYLETETPKEHLIKDSIERMELIKSKRNPPAYGFYPE